MKGNKDLGFDVLEDSDINIIEKIGTEKMNIDKNARDRMLKITMRKYEAEKADSAAKELSDDAAAEVKGELRRRSAQSQQYQMQQQ